MRRLIILPLLLLSLTLGATKVYVATTGNDGTGDGSSGNPYLTIAKGITEASSGDTVYVVAGTYDIAVQLDLPVGVSIMGEGATSIITSGEGLKPIILLYSASEGTDGSQSISHIYMDGDLTDSTLIMIYGRSNVKIHDCTFIDALWDGVGFHGMTDDDGDYVTTYATGNEFHDNIVTNCAAWDAAHAWNKGHGNLLIGGQDGMLIYNNTITQPNRASDLNGYGIKFCNKGDTKGIKIYNNNIDIAYNAEEYTFAIEVWSQRGGWEIYNNELNGSIDIGGYDTNDDGGYGYAMKIYNNILGFSELQAGTSEGGIDFELGMHGGIYVYQNYFRNTSRGIMFSVTANDLVPGVNDVYIYSNIFHNIRTSAAGYSGYVVRFPMGSYYVTLDNINIFNNTAYNDVAGTLNSLFIGFAGFTFTNIRVKNNIFYDGYRAMQFQSCTVDTFDVANNDFYSCSAIEYYNGSTITNDTYTDNITDEPVFKSTSTFRLSSSSPCIDAGIDVGLDYDYYGHKIIDTPDIGAMEYGKYIMVFNR